MILLFYKFKVNNVSFNNHWENLERKLTARSSKDLYAMTRSWDLSCRILNKETICSLLHFQKKGPYWTLNHSSLGGDQEYGRGVGSIFIVKKKHQDLVNCWMWGEGDTNNESTRCHWVDPVVQQKRRGTGMWGKMKSSVLTSYFEALMM